MRGSASPGRQQLQPKSLMQRLALLASGRLSPDEGAPSGRGQSASIGTLVSFGLGALMSSVLGGSMLLGLRTLDAGEAQVHVEGPASLREIAPETIDVAIERGERGRATLSLRVEGADGPGTELVLKGVPREVKLSKGVRRDAETWAVAHADFDALFLTLGETGPDAFDVRIDVLAPSRPARQAAVVRVRMVDTAAKELAATTKVQESPPDDKAPGEAKIEMPPARTDIAKLASAVDADAGRTPPTVAGVKATRPPPGRADQKPAGKKTEPVDRYWPEGASGLGAIAREPERQLWWSMPPPWSPFGGD